MRLYCLEREQWLLRPIEEVFSFFSRPENLQTITPPWLDFRMVESPEALEKGSLIRYRLRWRGVPIRWTTEMVVWDPPNRFVDRQLSGPYALWNHEHWFYARGGGTLLRDFVTYALPFGIAGWLAHAGLVKRDLKGIFDFRAETISQRFDTEVPGLAKSARPSGSAQGRPGAPH
jgi:ligand-binding SRPBCC domain-containing protein